MLHINPEAAPFALTPDNKVPQAIRDAAYWDDNGDVLLVTKDGIALSLRMKLLLRYSETVRSLLGHIEEVPQEGLWTPILELECNATELRAVLEYLLLQEQGTQLSIDSLARYAFSAYTLGITTLDEAALTGLLTCTHDRLNAYAQWKGTTEFATPPLKPVHAILAGRALPGPASSILAVAFVDLSIFGLEEEDAALSPRIEAPILQGPHDEDTVALLRERNAELVDALLKLSANFGRRRSLSRVGRPCCDFGMFGADRYSAPDRDANATAKGRSALSIIATVGTELEKARIRRALAKDVPPQQGDLECDGKSGCLSCLSELHRGMMRLYGQWWEDTGRLLMGEPQGGRSSAWDDVLNSLSTSRAPAPSNGWPERLRRFLRQIYRAVVDLQFRQ